MRMQDRASTGSTRNPSKCQSQGWDAPGWRREVGTLTKPSEWEARVRMARRSFKCASGFARMRLQATPIATFAFSRVSSSVRSSYIPCPLSPSAPPLLPHGSRLPNTYPKASIPNINTCSRARRGRGTLALAGAQVLSGGESRGGLHRPTCQECPPSTQAALLPRSCAATRKLPCYQEAALLPGSCPADRKRSC